MTDEPATEAVFHDSPNQQVVRADGSAPWDEGEGGPAGAPDATEAGNPLDAMTKAQLLEYAAANDVDSVDESMTKADIRAEIDAAA